MVWNWNNINNPLCVPGCFHWSFNTGDIGNLINPLKRSIWSFGTQPYIPLYSGYNIQTLNLYNMLNASFAPKYGQNNIAFPQIPTFGIGQRYGGLSTPTSSSSEQGVSADLKAKLDNIRTLKYDNTNIKSKLDEITNPIDIGNYITTTGKLARTIDKNDGSHIYLYQDANGNSIGSINKDKNGKIQNISLDIADSGSISINLDSDGKVINRVVMSKQNDESDNSDSSYKSVLNNFLNGEFKGISPKTENRSDGTIKISYTRSDGKYLNIIKDNSGKITSIYYASENTSTNQTLHTYTDTDGDGKIDAGEQTVRYDRMV